MNPSALIKAVMGLHPNMVGVAVIIGPQLNAEVRAEAPQITESDLVRMVAQAHQVTSIGKLNEAILGKLSYVVFRHKFITVMLFPMDTFNVLAVGVGELRDFERLAQKIKDTIIASS